MESSTEPQDPAQQDEEEMRRTFFWFIGAVLVSAGLVWALQAQEQQSAKAAASGSSAQQAAAPSDAGEHVAFRFTDEAQMAEYTKVLQERQGILIRMQVLQQYFSEEQSRLSALNKDIIAKYQLDETKAYILDAERKVLVEREAPPEPPPAQPGSASTPTAAGNTVAR